MTNGEKANKEFVCTYKFDGSKWSLTIWASTYEEAEMKLKAVGRGRVDGILHGIIPAGGKCPTCGRGDD